MALVTDSHFILDMDGDLKDVVQGTTDPVTGNNEMAIYLASVPVGKRQSIVGTLDVFKRYVLNNLASLTGEVATLVVWGPPGAGLAAVQTGGVPTVNDLRLEVGINFLTQSKSAFIDETFRQLVSAFLEASKSN